MKQAIYNGFFSLFSRLMLLFGCISCALSAQAQTDWSDSASIKILEPQLAKVNITGITKLPASSSTVAQAWMEFDDRAGNTFRKRVTLKQQGQNTLIYPKRNFSFKLCDDEWLGDSTATLQVGNWVKQDGFHLKAYYTDIFRGLGSLGYHLFDQVTATRGDSAMAWQRAGIDDHDKALCHPDGFPCELYLNDEFYGLYVWQLKKNRKNMNQRKDSAEHVHLDGILSDGTFFNTQRITWSQFEVRNPHKLYTMDGKPYDGDHPAELMDESSLYFSLDEDTPKIKRQKERTAKVKRYIEAFSGNYARFNALEEAGASKQAMRDSIATRYDIPSLLDYVCFAYFIGNSEAFRKNWQWFTYDGRKWSVAPYDLDLILGHSSTMIVPASMASISSDYRMLAINIGGPTYWLCRYFWEDICSRYEELRDAGIFTPENFLSMLVEWQQRIGQEAYDREQQAWPENPCYKQPLANEGWMTDGVWAGYSTIDEYASGRTYEPGDKCRQKERIWTATARVKGVQPCLQVGAPDSLPRVQQWLEEHEALMDEYLGYHGQQRVQLVEIDSSGWTTLNTMMECMVPDGLAVYKVNSAATPDDQQASALNLERVVKISPYNSYLVHGLPGSYTFSGQVVPIDWKLQSNYLVTGLLTGMDEWSYVPKGKYVLGTQDGMTAFYPVTEAQKTSVEAWQAFIDPAAGKAPACYSIPIQGNDLVPTEWASELPVIELYYEAAAFNADSYIPASFIFHDGDTVRQYSCTVRRRGATSLRLAKPNFALKFVNSKGEPKDVRFLDMRKDNNWILDGMASDHAKMRNRVSMDLWLDFSRPPYHQELEPKAVNGYRGHYVEVYANGEYMGLFCLMERLDRKQLKLKKFEPNENDSTTFHHRGLMYKAISGSSTRTSYFYWQQNEPDDTKSYYDGMQCEYPDVAEGEPWTWKPLRDNIYYMATRTGKTFMNGLPLRFDVPVFIDNTLFIDLLYANDNVGKNFFCWFYDQPADARVGYTPWDLDTSWGRDYLGNRVSATSDLSKKGNVDIRMQAQWAGYADTLSLRYASLRDSLWLEEALVKRFDDYFDLFVHTGAWQREQERWSGTNCNINEMEREQTYLHEWIHNRLMYLDEVYGYDPWAAIREVKPDDASDEARSYDLLGRKTSRGRGLRIERKGERHELHWHAY